MKFEILKFKRKLREDLKFIYVAKDEKPLFTQWYATGKVQFFVGTKFSM